MEHVTIQTVRHLSGMVTYKGHSTTAGLTPPTYASIRASSPIQEAADVITGQITLANMQFSFNDERGTFWRDFLSADTSEISVEITSLGVTEILFWGRVTKESVDFSEYDLYHTQRSGTF